MPKSVSDSRKVTDKSFYTIFQQSPVSTQIFSPDGETIMVNGAWEKLWAISFAKVKRYNILKDKQLVEEGIMPYIKRGFRGETVAIPAIKYMPAKSISVKGAVPYRWLSALIYPITDEKGKITEVVLQHHDITEAYEANEKLKKSEELFKATWENAVNAMALSDENGIVIAANPAYYRLYGYTEDEIVGKDFSVIFPKKVRSWARKEYQRMFHNPKITPAVESQIVRKDGTKRIVESRYTFVIHQKKRIAMLSIIRDITEEKKTQEELINRERHYRRLIENSSDVVAIVSEDGRFSYVSPAVTKVLGYTPEELEGRPVQDFFPRDEIATTLKKFEKVVSNPGETFVVRNRMLHKDGSIRWIESKTTNNLTNPDIKAFISNFRDVTEQVRAEQMQAQLAAIVASSSDAIISKTLDSIITSWNKAAEQMFGYTEEEAIGKPITIIVPPELQGEEIEIINQLHEGNNIDHFETIRVTKSGRRLNVSLSISSIRNEEGEIIGAANITRDITESVKQQQRQTLLEEVSGKLVTSLDHAVTIQEIAHLLVPELADYCRVVIVDRDKQIREIAVSHTDPKKISLTKQLYSSYISDPDTTHGVGKLLASGQSELIRVVDEHILKPVMNKRVLQSVKKLDLKSYMGVPLIARGKIIGAITLSSTQEHRYYTDEDLHLAEEIAYRIALILDNENSYRDALREIAERKKLEKQKDEFISIASHELKTPVTSIKAYGQVLQHAFLQRNDHNSAKQLAKMDVQIDKLTNLIGDLLDVTKIESGKIIFTEEAFVFDELVSEIVDELQHTTSAHEIKIVGKTGKTLSGDRERTGQVLTNLISNAIKYSPDTKDILVKLSADKKHVSLCVQDFGIGIPKEKQRHVFERFYRISGPKQDTYPGLGLGLYISSEIIKRQGGRIWVESEQGKGSSFCFTLPLTRKRRRKRLAN